MFKFDRTAVYFAYALLTLGCFAIANFWPHAVTTGLATNLLAGLIILTGIDSLLRLAEAHRQKPMRLVALKTDAVMLARLQNLLALLHERPRRWFDR